MQNCFLPLVDICFAVDVEQDHICIAFNSFCDVCKNKRVVDFAVEELNSTLGLIAVLVYLVSKQVAKDF